MGSISGVFSMGGNFLKLSLEHAFIYLLSKYLLKTYYVPHMTAGAENTKVDGAGDPCSHGV